MKKETKAAIELARQYLADHKDEGITYHAEYRFAEALVELADRPADVRYIDRPNEYDPPTEIEIEEFQRRAKMISYSTDPMRCETIHMVDESTGPLDPPSSLPTKKKPLAIKCSRGGCGTIIEVFWKFCPSCGTAVSFEARQRLLREEHGT